MGHPTYRPHVTGSLLEGQEWDKLECWLGVAWMLWVPYADETTEVLECAMTALFRQRPGSVQNFVQWMERWNTGDEYGLCMCSRTFNRSANGHMRQHSRIHRGSPFGDCRTFSSVYACLPCFYRPTLSADD